MTEEIPTMVSIPLEQTQQQLDNALFEIMDTINDIRAFAAMASDEHLAAKLRKLADNLDEASWSLAGIQGNLSGNPFDKAN